MTKLLTDTSYVSNFESSLHNIAEVGANAKEMSTELKMLIAKINDNDNIIGVLLSDSVSAHKLQTTIDKAETASAKLDENMEALKHNFLLKGYFKKQEKAKAKAKAN